MQKGQQLPRHQPQTNPGDKKQFLITDHKLDAGSLKKHPRDQRPRPSLEAEPLHKEEELGAALPTPWRMRFSQMMEQEQHLPWKQQQQQGGAWRLGLSQLDEIPLPPPRDSPLRQQQEQSQYSDGASFDLVPRDLRFFAAPPVMMMDIDGPSPGGGTHRGPVEASDPPLQLQRGGEDDDAQLPPDRLPVDERFPSSTHQQRGGLFEERAIAISELQMGQRQLAASNSASVAAPALHPGRGPYQASY